MVFVMALRILRGSLNGLFSYHLKGIYLYVFIKFLTIMLLIMALTLWD